MTAHPKVVCEYGFVHAQCRCPGPHTTRTIVCNIPAHQKENSVTQDNVVTPEDVAAMAPDEADGYTIPAYDETAVDDEDSPAPTCATAFLVIVNPDGTAYAISELNRVVEITPAREANLGDMRNACQQVVQDVQVMQTAQQTVALMQQSAQQMAEQQRNAKMVQALQKKGIQVPTGGRRS